MAPSSPLRRLVRLIWGDWQTNELWQRIVKTSLAYTIALIIAVIPQVAPYGLNSYLVPMTTLFAHPGQRMAKMIESLVLILVGALVGLGWSLLGLHLSTLVIESSPAAASTIRALFFLIAVLFHGMVRSSTPRLFVSVWLLLLTSALTLMGTATQVTLKAFTSIYYPILAATAVVLVVNLCIFPELSTSYLGTSTIETLSEATDTLTRATHWFVTPGGDSDEAKAKETESAAKDKKKKNTWLQDFLSEFPNPFETTRNQAPSPGDGDVHLTTFASLSDKKSKLRAALLRCKDAQDEINFEYSISPLPSKSLKPISKHCMSGLVQNTVTLIGACENKFVLLNTALAEDDIDEKALSTGLAKGNIPAPIAPHILEKVTEDNREDSKSGFQRRIDDVKPLREIESGSVELLESVIRRLRTSIEDFDAAFKEATALAMACVAYCFDVPKLPSGAKRPRGIELEEIDLRIDSFTAALARFDQRSTEELKMAAMGESGQDIDLMPRMEMFLISSFLLGLRQAATRVLQLLQHSRELVEQRKNRNDRPRVWLPHYADIRQWLSTAGESDAMVLPERARKGVRTGKSSKPAPSADSSDSSTSQDHLQWQKKDEENTLEAFERGKSTKRRENSPGKNPKPQSQEHGLISRVRGRAADALEWAQHSDDFAYSLKLAVAVFIVSWPSFVTSWRAWYADARGIWAPMQLVLIFEMSIGTSLFVFFLRLFGVIYGCVMGYAAFEICRGHRAAMVVILMLALVPCVYIQIGTKYTKMGMIGVSTMAVVSLGAMNLTGTAYENFYKRLSAFLIGSLVAIIVEMFIYPVRARDRLVESLSASVRQVQSMHSAVSVGIDGPEKPNFRSQGIHSRFQRSRDKAQAALTAAETFLPFCLTEPRLKGSFKPLEPIYQEIIFCLHQIIDRLDNAVDLRKAYGSSVLEDLNAHVYAYRRNVAASISLMLFSVHEALTTWLPLPQFIPSTRLAQLRLISRVREVLEDKMSRDYGLGRTFGEKGEVENARTFVTKRKFLAWNANASGQMEIIEYLEELVELTKLLVGVNAFRSGLLERPHYKDYVQQAKESQRSSNELSISRSAPSPLSREPSAAPAEEQGDSLRRVVTVAATVQKFRQKVRNNREHASNQDQTSSHQPAVPETAVEEVDGDALPMTLRRVGTRMRRDSAAVRRRGFSTGRAMS